MNVSVVVPAYNREKTIGRCLDSILSQVLSPREIVVVDDGSDDRTVEIVEKYRDNYKNVKLVLQNRGGAQRARNRGIKEASSEWIAFLDSDDEWCPEYLKRINQEIIKSSNDRIVICTSCYRDSGDGREVWHLPGASGNVHSILLVHPWPMFQGMVVKKRELEKIGYLDENCPAFQEWETNLRLSKECEYIFIDEPLFVYYVNQSISTISGTWGNDYKGRKYIVHKYKQEIIDTCGYRVLSKHYRAMSERIDGLTHWTCHFIEGIYLIRSFFEKK